MDEATAIAMITKKCSSTVMGDDTVLIMLSVRCYKVLP